MQVVASRETLLVSYRMGHLVARYNRDGLKSTAQEASLGTGRIPGEGTVGGPVASLAVCCGDQSFVYFWVEPRRGTSSSSMRTRANPH